MTTELAEIENAKLAAMTDEQLEGVISQCFGVTVRMIVTMASALRILEERGRDLSGLNVKMKTMLGWLRMVGHEQFHPELCSRFLGNTPMLKLLSGLPMPDQKQLADSRSIAVMELDETGKPTRRMVPLENLEKSQIRQVFGPCGLRSQEDQILQLKAGMAVTRRAQPDSDVTVDRKNRVAVVKRPCRLSVAQLLDLARQASG